MGVNGLSGYSPSATQLAKVASVDKGAAAAVASSPSNAGSSPPPVDTVSISPEAQLKLGGANQIAISSDTLTQAAALAKGVAGLADDAQRFSPEAMAAHANWREKHTEYMSKVRDLVGQTFGLNADENGWAASGAALNAIKNLAEKNGLKEPEMPPKAAEMLQAKSWSIWGQTNDRQTGTFDIVFNKKGADNGGNVRILFDGSVKQSSSGSLIDLRGAGEKEQEMLSKVKNSALGKELDSIGGWSAKSKSNAYAITGNDDGGGASVVGVVLTENKDEYAKQNAAGILSTLRGLIS